jgi:two-component system sensor histidine kinase KdpD
MPMLGPADECFLNTFLIASWIVSFPIDETRGRDIITGVALRASGPRKRRRRHGAHGLNAKRIDVATKLDVAAVRASHGGADKSALPRCLLVIPGSSEYDLNLIHASQRLAAALHAEWAVVFVQTFDFRILPHRDRARRLEVLRLVESLGGESVVLHGINVARTIAAYARLRQAVRILVGSPARLSWHAITQYTRVAALKRHAPDIDIMAIAPRDRRTTDRHSWSPPPQRAPRASIPWNRYLWGLGTTVICTAAALPISAHVDPTNIVMLYLLGMCAAGLWLGRGPSALAAIANTAAFDYFFVPPRFSFMVFDGRYFVTFGVMLLVALIIANLMIAVRKQTEAAGAREQHTAALYAITRDLAALRDARSMAELAVRRIGEELQSCALILVCDENGRLNPSPFACSGIQRPVIDAGIAHWVTVERQRAGMGTQHCPLNSAMYLPLVGLHATIGVLIVERVEPGCGLLPEQQQLLEAFSGQLASALERTRLTDIAHAAQLAVERAAMRNTLLASISHDLRTPLSAIAGAGSIVAQDDFALDIYRRVMLGRLIEDKARDMSDLLTNVLELVRLESGPEVLNCDWHSLTELVGLAIRRHEARLTGRQVIADVPEDLPMLRLDATLFVQLLGNLLENAVKYTPPHACISIAAAVRGGCIQLVVEDNGPGWSTDAPEQLFERFSREQYKSAVGGFGLGLAICQAVVRLHSGDIRAAHAREGGARIEIDFPLPELEPCAPAPALAI